MMTRKVKAPEREQGDRLGYGAEGYGYKDTGQFTKIPVPKKKVDDTDWESVAKSPKMGDGSGIPVSKKQLKKEKDIDKKIRGKLGLAEAMNYKQK